MEPPTVSYWEAHARDAGAGAGEAAPALGEDARCEVAVIGAGCTGLSAALELARRGVDVRVLEAHDAGAGASARNGGFCCVGSARLPPATIIRRHGLPAAREFFTAQVQAVGHVRDVAAREGIDIAPLGDGELELAHRPSEMNALRARGRLLHEAFGYRPEVLEPDALRALTGAIGRYGGLRMPDGFGMQPANYVRGLADAMQRAGGRLHAHSPVQRWRREAGQHALYTPHARLLARRVIVATAGYTPDTLHPQLAGTVLAVSSSILVTRPLTASELGAQGWNTFTPAADSRHLVHYFRLLGDGRFLFGGRGGSGRPEALRAALLRRFRRLFPAWAQVPATHFWSGQLCMARDLLPHAVALDDDSVRAALCYHGNGVAMGSWTGTQLALETCGVPSRIPALMRRPLPRFPLPVLRPVYRRAALATLALADAWPPRVLSPWSTAR